MLTLRALVFFKQWRMCGSWDWDETGVVIFKIWRGRMSDPDESVAGPGHDELFFFQKKKESSSTSMTTHSSQIS